MKQKNFYYFVEGETEEKLIKVLRSELQVIYPGKIQKLNVVQEKISNARIMQIKPNTNMVLVFDTDTNSPQILLENIHKLRKCPHVSHIICVTQVLNLEDELIRCCNIRHVTQLTSSSSIRQFKRDFITDTHLAQKLLQHDFNISLLWAQSPPGTFHMIENEGGKINRK